MRLFLQPNDTFFFRDGRPFTKGEQSEGYSIFPPLPQTILGALRTAYIAEHGNLSAFYAKKMENIIGTPDSLGSMKLKGVFLADRESGIYFPIPLDLVVKNNEEKDVLYALECYPETANFISSAPLQYHLRWDESKDDEPEEVESETSGKLKHTYMKEYLLDKRKFFRFIPREHFISDEPKIGIGRDRTTLTSEEGMLYRINMSRFQSRFLNMSDLGFVVDYQCDEELPSKGILKLGGEGKSFVYESSDHNPNPLSTDVENLKAVIKDSGNFKLYFATPTIFEQGWLPRWIDKTTKCGHYLPSGIDWGPTHPISIQLVTAAVGKSIPIGGWNIKKGMPKPTYRAVPAGSVYYFNMLDGSCADDVINAFHYQNISDCQAAEGFGLCFVGIAGGGKV